MAKAQPSPPPPSLPSLPRLSTLLSRFDEADDHLLPLVSLYLFFRPADPISPPRCSQSRHLPDHFSRLPPPKLQQVYDSHLAQNPLCCLTRALPNALPTFLLSGRSSSGEGVETVLAHGQKQEGRRRGGRCCSKLKLARKRRGGGGACGQEGQGKEESRDFNQPRRDIKGDASPHRTCGDPTTPSSPL